MSECKISGAYAGMLALIDPDPELNSTDRAIYGLVVFRCNGDRKRHISHENIMTDLPHITTRQTIAASIKKLVSTGRLKVSRQRYGANLYEVEDPTGRLYSKVDGVKNTLHREGIGAETSGVKPDLHHEAPDGGNSALHHEAAGDGGSEKQILHDGVRESYTDDVKLALHQEVHKEESQKKNTQDSPLTPQGGLGEAVRSSPSTSVSGEVIRHPGRSKASVDEPPEFLAFWKAYPRKKEGPGAARKPWHRATSRATPEEIMAGLASYAFNASEGGRWLPQAATWLNQERWRGTADTAPQSVVVPFSNRLALSDVIAGRPVGSLQATVAGRRAAPSFDSGDYS